MVSLIELFWREEKGGEMLLSPYFLKSHQNGPNTYGIGMGIGNGKRIFLPPFRSMAVRAAFFRSAFLPASTWLGARMVVKTTATTKSVQKTLKYFILVSGLVCV